ATIAGIPIPTRAGNVTKVPPPAMEFTALPRAPARNPTKRARTLPFMGVARARTPTPIVHLCFPGPAPTVEAIRWCRVAHCCAIRPGGFTKGADMSTHHHSLGQESITTGLIGAGVVALWFLALDLIKGQPLITPSVLGQVIIFQKTDPNLVE